MADLQAVLPAAFACLAEGAADPASPFRTPALATAGPGAAPGLRTLVLRRFLPDARAVELHTDARSPKMAALRADPRAALLFWHAGRRVQLRLEGPVTIATGPEADQSWAALPPGSRATYAVSLPPGTPIANPAEARPDLPPAAARAVFTVLRLGFDTLEYLSLARGAQCRARFVWSGETLVATWLVP
jgi:pyridoxine/pyridoxamine 5'-phosphate oxidase